MTEDTHVVRRATVTDIRAVGAALADAFTEDPVLEWLIPPGVWQRSRRIRRLFTTVARTSVQAGRPVFVADRDQGAAIWLPPVPPRVTTAASLRELIPMTTAFGGGVRRASRLLAQMQRLHPKTPPHWYLYFIGTRSASQGRGLGAAMLREVLSQADAAGEPAYLESSNYRNVPLYERHGFTVVEEIVIDGGGPRMWRMWRDPQA